MYSCLQQINQARQGYGQDIFHQAGVDRETHVLPTLLMYLWVCKLSICMRGIYGKFYHDMLHQ